LAAVGGVVNETSPAATVEAKRLIPKAIAILMTGSLWVRFASLVVSHSH
jgi:hypothetical protein